MQFPQLVDLTAMVGEGRSSEVLGLPRGTVWGGSRGLPGREGEGRVGVEWRCGVRGEQSGAWHWVRASVEDVERCGPWMLGAWMLWCLNACLESVDCLDLGCRWETSGSPSTVQAVAGNDSPKGDGGGE